MRDAESAMAVGANAVRKTSLASAFCLLVGLLALASAVFSPVAGAAVPSLFWETPQGGKPGTRAGEIGTPGGIASNPTNGHIYVADNVNQRITEFSIWGQFVRTWGHGVISGGAVGSGDLTAGSTKITSVSNTSKYFLPEQTIEGPGIPGDTTILGIGVNTLTLSKPATASGTGVQLVAPEGAGNTPANERQVVRIVGSPSGGSFTLTFFSGQVGGDINSGSKEFTNVSFSDSYANPGGVFRVGDVVASSDGATGIPPGATITSVGIDKLTMSEEATQTRGIIVSAEETTSSIAFDAPPTGPGSVQAALEALPAIGAGNVAVSGAAGGPYTVEFKGALADTELPELRPDPSALTPPGGPSIVTSQVDAAPAEVCVLGESCQGGVSGGAAGQFGEPSKIAADGLGNPYVFDATNQSVQKFDPEGNFEVMWGGDVVAHGPDDSANDEVQQVQIAAAGGTFRLGAKLQAHSKGADITGPLAFNASAAQVDAALEKLAAIGGQGGSVAVTGGPGDGAGTVPYQITFEDNLGGDDVPQLTLFPAALSAGESSELTTINQGGGPEICKSADVCKQATPGSANGQFSDSVFTSIAVDAAGTTVYVGDTDRIQEFDPDGTYKGQLPLPVSGTPRALAIDPSGNLYLAIIPTGKQSTMPGVFKLNPSGEHIATLSVNEPDAIATGSAGEVFVAEARSSLPTVEPRTEPEVLEFDSTGACVICPGEAFERLPNAPIDLRVRLFSLGTNSACGLPSDNLYVGHMRPGGVASVRAFGPLPDPLLCPPPEVAPTISSQLAESVDTESAALRARINPHFWSGPLGATRYYVEYGTAPCSEGGCAALPTPPGAKLNADAVDKPILSAGVFLSGLEPNTTYHYRFVAESNGGGPVRGVGGIEGEDGKEGTFRTFAPPSEPAGGCQNQSFRSGSSAHLPNCRAYELVSPVEKGNVAIDVRLSARGHRSELNQSSLDGEKFTYSAERAFGDAISAPYSSQYIATRKAGEAWLSHAISPPRESPSVTEQPTVKFDVQYKAFSDDLCSGWLLHDTDPALAPGAVEGFLNLYRRGNCGEEEGGYEALTVAEPPGTNATDYWPELQGVSADGATSVFTAPDKLTADAADGNHDQLYAVSGGELRLVSVLPAGQASPQEAVVGAGETILPEGRETTVARGVSEDGARIVWTTGNALYVRENPTQLESFHLLGRAIGTGDSVGPAKGTGTLTDAFKTITEVSASAGAFAVGQEISAEGLPPGTTVTAVEGKKLKISKAATVSKEKAVLSATGLTTVSNLTTTSGAFAVGQELIGEGIADGTTILAKGPSSLTLSVAATGTASAGALEATSECTEAAKACTTPIARNATYRTADSEGGTVVYTVGDRLFEFDVAARAKHLIADGFEGVAGASEDATRVYFVSTEVLAGSALAGKPNLYLYESESEATSFVATLDARDVDSDRPYALAHEKPIKLTTRVTPDGSQIAFMSSGALTSYDNADIADGEPAAEVYLYDAGEGELRCISCNPSGAQPSGREFKGANGADLRVAAKLPIWQNFLFAPRALAESGQRLFFESVEPLVLRDTNGKMDVYQWERADSGEECQAAGAELFVEAADGCLSLISSGESASDSQFVDASPDGRDVFFKTASSLLPQDTGLVDIYDAREGGGLPTPLAGQPECEGEACQGTPSPPNDQTPASLSFEGAGNVVSTTTPATSRCAKGKVRRKGRCVKKAKSAKAKKAHRRAKHNRGATR